MTSTLEIRPDTLREAAIEAPPATFNVSRGGPFETSGLNRKGTFVGRMDLTLDDRRLTVAGPYLSRKTTLRTSVHWAVFLAAWAVATLALMLATQDLVFAFPMSLPVAGVVVMLLEWTRRRPRTGELTASDVAVEKVKGRRLWLRGPFELERPEARQKLAVRARTKEDAAALAQLLG